MSRQRSILGMLWNNIAGRTKSAGSDIRIVGKDYMGNVYYERDGVKAGEKITKRYYNPPEEDSWDKPLPPEWESWLRYRRPLPTDEEVGRNIAVAQLKKARAADLEAKRQAEKLDQDGASGGVIGPAGAVRPEVFVRNVQRSQDKAKEPLNDNLYNRYPQYDDYETVPGDTFAKQQKKDPKYDK
ncbi:hypothetical protein HDE_07907 [Halotydeus destructor]|nr:hypothetical protein HDE_07907 [Halotydeus destructor]